jgi:succinyl-CoA synthetase beta subunit
MKIILSLYDAGVAYDAELVEINPLILTDKGDFVAADARLLVDDNSLYRHHEIAALMQQRTGEFSEREVEASKMGFAYVEMDGNIGIVGNGAGLVMATLDLVKLYGGEPANFLDIGGGAGADVMEEAVSLLLENPKVQAILVNILGGITDCADVAHGLVGAFKQSTQKKPVVVRLVGNNQEEGRRILSVENIASL